MELLDELVGFVKSNERLDVKSLALHHILSLTGDFESRKLLIRHVDAVDVLTKLAFDETEQKSINKDAFLCLINLSADELDANALLKTRDYLLTRLLNYIVDESSRFADTACAVLSNLSRGKANSELIFNNYFKPAQESSRNNFEKVLQVFCTENFNKLNRLDYLAPFICNLTQLEEVQKWILSDSVILQRLLPYTTYKRSIVRRGGIIGALKNCCFNYDFHEKLLFSPEIDILSRFLLPLAGPEELDSDEMDKLPDDLQYLPPDKEREDDSDIRTMLIESLMMLCSHKTCRDFIKEKNAYVILREYHKWETDEPTKLVLEKLIQILISDEPETDLENFHQISVPEELSKKFYDYEKTELEKNFE